MGMMQDLYNEEYAKDALEEAETTKRELMETIEELNTMIFILKYFLDTGEPLDPTAFGYDDLGEDLDD